MNFRWLDWAILAALLALPLVAAHLCRKYIRGVADYLVAGRSVGRYLGLGSDAMQGMGAVTILAYWQMTYQSGLAGHFWYWLTPLTGILVALTGWGIYRLRETGVLTLGQLVGMRYGRKTRIFFGCLVYFAGILNMGIFPAVGAGFFIYYCGLPESVPVGGIEVKTILLVMVLLVGVSMALCLWGGQVTVVVTDFVQSLFVNAMLIGVMVILYRAFTWDQVAEAYFLAENGDALVHPFRAEGASEFDYRFFLIHVYYWMLYSVLSWSPNSLLVSSARDAHEARMMRVWLHTRNLALMGLGLFILPIAAFVLMNHPDFARQAAEVTRALSGIENEQVRSQMLTPASIVHILPTGLLGAIAGVVLIAFITNHDTYLLTWGSVLIQDVVVPLRGKPLPRAEHLRWLRISVVVVAVFIVAFSMLFRQVDNIFMFMDISASLYTGAAGVVLLGALYWRRATTQAALCAMTGGALLSAAGFVSRSLYPDFLDGRIMAFWISIVCIVLFVGASYLGRDPRFDLDGMLRRAPADRSETWRWPKQDRAFAIAVSALIGMFAIAFAATTIENLRRDVPVSTWLGFWRVYLFAAFAAGSAVLLWTSFGGVRDLRRFFRSLGSEAIDERDDGRVEYRSL